MKAFDGIPRNTFGITSIVIKIYNISTELYGPKFTIFAENSPKGFRAPDW